MKAVYKYSEQEAVAYAKEAAKVVEIRSYEDGSSRDEMRESTEEEKAMLENAICAALLAIRGGYEDDSAKATAEFFVIHGCGGRFGKDCKGGYFEPHINTYGSVYIPICKFLEGKEKKAIE